MLFRSSVNARTVLNSLFVLGGDAIRDGVAKGLQFIKNRRLIVQERGSAVPPCLGKPSASYYMVLLFDHKSQFVWVIPFEIAVCRALWTGNSPCLGRNSPCGAFRDLQEEKSEQKQEGSPPVERFVTYRGKIRPRQLNVCRGRTWSIVECQVVQ